MNELNVNFLQQYSAVYVTGTDTGIGKTYASVALLQALRQQGRLVQGMKPVASGCQQVNGFWRNEDALALMQAAESSANYDLVNPYALPLATAPQIAAKAAGIELQMATLKMAYTQLAQPTEFVLVEGVGGWLAPLSSCLDQSTLVSTLDIPVVLVVGMRLGCINHARLTERAIAADGFNLLGWIANACESDFDSDGRYFEALAAVMQSPCVGRLEFNGPQSPR